MLTKETFIQEVLSRSPGLRASYEEHLADYDELLPHVFMGDVTRYIMGMGGNSTAESAMEIEKELSELLDLFEASLADGDEYVQELVVTSFLENLEASDPAYPKIKARLGQRLSEQLRTIEAAFH
jgi:hypothetical protein